MRVIYYVRFNVSLHENNGEDLLQTNEEVVLARETQILMKVGGSP